MRRVTSPRIVTPTALRTPSQLNNWPIYQSLHGNKGCIAATAWLDESQADTDATALEMMWFRPVQSSSQWYPYGWEESILVDMLAAKYTPPPASVFPGLQAINPVTSNTLLEFDGGQLTSPILKRVNLTTTNTGGHGYFQSTKPTVPDFKGESGKVLWRAMPAS